MLVGRAVGMGVLVRVAVGSGVLVAVGVAVLVGRDVGGGVLVRVAVGVLVRAASADTLKLHILCEPAAANNAQVLKPATLACSVRKAKLMPTTCSVPLAGVTKMS